MQRKWLMLKPVFHYATFFVRSDFRLLKLNRFQISSSRELTRAHGLKARFPLGDFFRAISSSLVPVFSD